MNALLFKGTGLLTKLMVRQNRFKIALWLVCLIGITILTASVYPGAYPNDKDVMAYALTMENPAMKAMLGPGYPLEDYNLGTAFAQDMLIFTAIAVAVMNILIVGRSTRADEEDGRIEIIRSLPVGRLSYLCATLIVMTVTNLLLALITGFGLYFIEIRSFDFESSLLYGAILGGTGLIFAAMTAFLAQIAQTSRGTSSITFAALIFFYFIRAIGDVSLETLSLLSPLGWIVRTEVFVDNEWWPIWLSVILAMVFGIIAFYLNGLRDIDSGLIPERKGKSYASSFLKTNIGFAFRMQRTNIISWLIGLFILSAIFGAVLGDLEAYFADNDMVQALLPQDSAFSLSEQFITMLIAIMSLLSVIPAVMVVLKLKGEESKNRTEHFYSRAISRNTILGTYVTLAVMVSVMMQIIIALGLWSVAVNVMDHALGFGETLGAALIYLPSMWIVISIAVLLIGIAPKITSFVWLYVTYGLIVVYLSGLLEFPNWLNNLSSFNHVPQIPAEEMNFLPLIILTIVSIFLSIIGFIGYNKRDIAG